MNDDRLIPRLLAGRDQLSRIEKDQILDSVLGAPPQRRMRWLWLAVPALAAVALFVIAPWHTETFTARGSSRPVAVLHVSCTGGCTQGAKLLFDLHGTTSYRYFAAFAKRSDGTVLWYFPTADDAESVGVPAGGVLDRGVVLGAEHPAGTYRIYGVFSSSPLTRATIRDAFDATKLTAGDNTAVVTSDVEIR